MKKNLYLVAIVATMFMFGACSNEDKEGVVTKETSSIIASTEESFLKTTLNPEGLDVYWSEGDKFAVPYNSSTKHEKYEYTLTSSGVGKKIGTFTSSGELPTNFTLEGKVAVYPSVNPNYDNGTFSFTISDKISSQSYNANNKLNLPMYGTIKEGKVKFQHIFGVFRVVLDNSIGKNTFSLEKIMIKTGTNFYKKGIISQLFNKSSDKPTGDVLVNHQSQTSASEYITYSINYAVTLGSNEAKSFDIIAPYPGSSEKDGIESIKIYYKKNSSTSTNYDEFDLKTDKIIPKAGTLTTIKLNYSNK